MFAGDDYNYLKPFWNFDNDECDIEKLRAALPALSGGEQIMARFFCGVWTGENPLEFDMFQAAKKLDDTQLKIIQQWLAKPEFP